MRMNPKMRTLKTMSLYHHSDLTIPCWSSCSPQPKHQCPQSFREEGLDKLYSLYYFYHGSSKLVTESSPARPLLVATALMGSASENFQFGSILLSNHVDVLCEFLLNLNEEETAVSQSVPGAAVLPTSSPPGSSSENET